MNEQSREIFGKAYQIKIPITKVSKQMKVSQKLALPNDIEEENTIYVAQLQELARVFSSSGDRHIRQYIINLAKGVLERASDYAKVEAYIAEMLS